MRVKPIGLCTTLALLAVSAFGAVAVGVPSAVASPAPYSLAIGGCYINYYPQVGPSPVIDIYISIQAYNLPASADGSGNTTYEVAAAGQNFVPIPNGPWDNSHMGNPAASAGRFTATALVPGSNPINVQVAYLNPNGATVVLPAMNVNQPSIYACQNGSGTTAVSTPPGVVPAPVVDMTSTPNQRGYWMVGSNGQIYSFGNAFNVLNPGSFNPAPPALNQPIVGMAGAPDGRGYWLVASDGGIFSYGDAHFYGSTGNIRLNKPIVGMAATPDGKGYWLVASDGGIFAFGDARFYGSTGNIRLNQPVVGMAPNDATGGYWLVAADGGIFSFHAPFHGSTGNIRLNQPIVGMEAPTNGSGYRFVASDGGVFCFNVPFAGSTGNIRLNEPIAGIAPSGPNGYWLVSKDGGIFSFATGFYGSLG